jgi:hypothetical protein
VEALELCLLLCDRAPEKYGRAVLRSHGRYCREVRDVTLEEAQAALATLALLPAVRERGASALSDLLYRRGLEQAGEALNAWQRGQTDPLRPPGVKVSAPLPLPPGGAPRLAPLRLKTHRVPVSCAKPPTSYRSLTRPEGEGAGHRRDSRGYETPRLPRDKVEAHDAFGRLPHCKSTDGGSSASRTSSGSRPPGPRLDAEHPRQVLDALLWPPAVLLRVDRGQEAIALTL